MLTKKTVPRKPIPHDLNQGDEIGCGSFGTIYAIDDHTVVKVWDKSAWMEFKQEQHILNKLRCSTFPQMLDFGFCGKQKRAWITLPRYYATLEDDPEPGPDCLDRVGTQLLRQIQNLHDHDIIHRDIKPKNIMWRTKDKVEIVLIDFGTACSTLRSGSKKPKPRLRNQFCCTTYAFASDNALLEFSQSKRDDIESLVWTLHDNKRSPYYPMYCHESNHEMLRRRRLPRDKYLRAILRYTRGLKFKQTPNYDIIVYQLNFFYKKKL